MTINKDELNALIEDMIESEVESRHQKILRENNVLRDKISSLQDKVNSLTETNVILKSTSCSADTLIEVFKLFDEKIMSIQEKPLRGDLVYKLLDVLFVRDFDENTYECPTWLGAVTNYYSNKDIVIDLLKVLKIDMPKNIHDFRLPIDWTEKELDMFFESVPQHTNCNNCSFEDNLRFWKPHCLDNVAMMVNRTYSEIPWQFVLQNPLIKKEKYLKQIGEHAFKPADSRYMSSNWYKFFKITDYQELTDEEKLIIINNMSNINLKESKSDNLKNFILKNIELIDDDNFLTQIYDQFLDNYIFNYTNTLLRFPYKFIVKFVEEHKNNGAVEWISKNREHFTQEQRKELLVKLMED